MNVATIEFSRDGKILFEIAFEAESGNMPPGN